MGYIEIPKISVSLPIYHGTGEEVLSKGAWHLQGSALPVGGENTHCVISAHRGLPSAAMFTDLDQLEIGDHFYISVLNETLCYEVEQILVVEPEDTSALDVAEGMDLVTLVTCTPYGVNTQRLLVRGRRVPYTQETMEQEAEMPVRSVYTNYALWIIGGLVITALFILGMLLFLRRRDRQAARRIPMKRKLFSILIPALIFLTGLGVLLYPVFSDLWNQSHQNQTMEDYTQRVESLTDEGRSALWQAAADYNDNLDPAFQDAFSGKQPSADNVYWSLLNPDGTGVMGYIEIPKISLRLPIYHGTGDTVLENGVGHLAGTSLPVGGSGTHCVLSGHRGLPTAALFTDLDQLETGDRFYLYVLDQTLCYEVDQIETVLPEEVSDLRAVPGEDYVTLLTCTPYGVNTHRLLVRGHRVQEDNVEIPRVSTARQVVHAFGWKGKLLAALIGLMVVAVVIWRLKKRKKTG